MPSSLPWSDPSSDPVGQLRAALAAAREEYLSGASLNERARYQFDAWVLRHLIGHGGSFLFEQVNGFTEWIECASCHERLVLPLGQHKGKLNGLTPSLVLYDEFVGFDRIDWDAPIADKVYQRIYEGGRRSGKHARVEAFEREYLNEWTPQGDRSTPSPDTHHDALIALCLEHPWLSPRTNTGGSAAAIPSTK